MSSLEGNNGSSLLWNPIATKGTAFEEAEREGQGVTGLLPPSVESLETQSKRVKWQLDQLTRDIDKYTFMTVLSATNQRLYYKVLTDHLVELLPIVYTPTVGEGCINFSRLYLKPAGMYFSAFRHRGNFRKMLDNWSAEEVEIIVVTDGGRILGLGDLGTNGMGISIGKISLYVAGAGFDPKKALPVCLDCGTDNINLHNDPFYLGEKHNRIHGEEHQVIVEEFCTAVKDKWPHCLIQFEDFKTEDAFEILERMRDRCLCFNDDIQGTAAVVAAGFLNGLKVQQTKMEEVRVVFCGAGSSGCGVAHMLASILQSEGGLSKEASYRGIYLVDSKGLITNGRTDTLSKQKKEFVRIDGAPLLTELLDIVRYVKPHALLGLTGGGTQFTKEVIEEICQHCAKPLIFPLSNPTSKAEISAENAYKWSDGKCLFAAGSPFPPVEYNDKTYVPGQANNVFIFPGVGFGAVAVGATTVNDEMLLASAKELAANVKSEDLEQGRLYPDVKNLRQISIAIAREVARTAVNTKVAIAKKKMMQYAVLIISKIASIEY